MLKFVIIAVGGAIGALARYGLGGLVQQLTQTASFPAGTLVVNLTGCLLIGIGGGLMEARQFFNPEMRAFLFIGFLGSFTTFSTFGLESFNLARDGQWLLAALNIGLSVMVGLAAVLAGSMLAKLL
ncbi:MAG: fluoride efflux transporter CrcB [Desulfosarcinaceae bacterium]|nr:fluoride efflux transporter CrcB [Desulfosarcinaceae bacterium]